MNRRNLTPERQAEAERIEDILIAKARVEVRQTAQLLASKEDHDLLGRTEFEVRDSCHRIGAHALDAALAQRKNRGAKVPQ